MQRVYEPGSAAGYRVLVDRVWPRGKKKDELKLDEWLKELAPSTELRKWFGHDPARWQEFRQRYRRELASKGDEIRRLGAIARRSRLILLYGARDPEHNQAVVLKELIEKGGGAKR